MRIQDPALLLTRPADLVRLGLSWTGCTIESGIGGAPVLVAGGSATVTLTFPPQAVVEQSLSGAGDAIARLSGTSRLCFDLPAGTRLQLTSEAMMAALTQLSLVAATSAGDVGGTLLELPAGLLTTTAGLSGMAATAMPVVGANGTTGLWQASIRGASATASLRPLDWRPDDPALLAGQLALTAQDRETIVKAGSDLAAVITLGALGATLNTELATGEFRWSHGMAQGRDQQVTVVSKGVLYPLGHRATFVRTTRRAIGDDPASSAALRTTEQIIVTEPVRSSSRQDFRFATIEVLTRNLSFAQGISRQLRPIPDLDLPEIHERDALDDQLGLVQARIAELVDGLGNGLDGLAALGCGEANDYSVVTAEIAELQGQLDNPDGTEVPSGVAAVKAKVAQDTATAKQLWVIVHQADLDFRAELKEDRVNAKTLSDQISSLTAQIKAITEILSNPPEVSFWPADEGGKPLRFDVKLATPRGDLSVQMPLVFVHDLNRPADAHLPEFASLTDATVSSTLKRQWAAARAGEVDLPGVAFDLVQAAVPEAGDVHEIYRLTIEAAGVVGTYAPRIAQIEAKIASLKALLPDQDKLVALVYNTAADAGVAPLLPALPFDIDFLAHADRSGGLVAPKFRVDAMSRTLGPAARAVLGGVQVPNFAELYKETRLLGLSLGELIDTAASGVAIPGGPTIVPVLEGMRPVGVRLEWMKLPLKAAGIFRPLGAEPAAPCQLDLEVRIVGEDSVTSATVRNFALAMPAKQAVATLGFTSLDMVQAKGKPPAVHATGIHFELAGVLALLKDLQDKVVRYFGLNDPGIVVRRTPTGITAGYAFTLPDVSAGVFLMRNLGVSIDLDIPFNGDEVSITIGFARADNPFVLAVTIFGGGGYLLITLARSGVKGIDLSLQFGAFVAVSFAVAKGEVHAFGAVRLTGNGDSVMLDASIRLGGSVDVLGLVSVSIELLLRLSYDGRTNRLVGQATLVIEVHVIFFSRSIKLDSGLWVLAGSETAADRRLAHDTTGQPLDPRAAEAEWTTYWQAFA